MAVSVDALRQDCLRVVVKRIAVLGVSYAVLNDSVSARDVLSDQWRRWMESTTEGTREEQKERLQFVFYLSLITVTGRLLDVVVTV